MRRNGTSGADGGRLPPPPPVATTPLSPSAWTVSSPSSVSPFRLTAIVVKDIRAEELVPEDGTTCDPYVEIRVGDRVQKTDVIKENNMTPHWTLPSEGLRFQIDYSAQSVTVHFTVWDHDTFSSDDFLGFASLPITQSLAETNGELEIALDLEVRNDKDAEELKKYLCQNRQLGKLFVKFEVEKLNTLLSPTAHLKRLAQQQHHQVFLSPTTIDEMHTSMFDSLFEAPLTAKEPVIHGERQKMNIHVIRQRARHIFCHSGVMLFRNCCLLAVALTMLSTPHGTVDGAVQSFATFVYVFALVAACCEFFLYGLGFGVLPNLTSKNSISATKMWSILSVWLPPRLRQSAVGSSLAGSENTLLGKPPLLENGVIVAELLVVLLSVIGYALPGGNHGEGIGRMRYLHGLRSLRLVTPLTRLMPTVSFLVTAFQESMSMLASAMTFLAFFFVVFGVLGVDQFKAQLAHRCVLIDPELQFNYSTGPPLGELCLNRGRAVLDSCIEAYPPVFCDEDASESGFLSPVVCPPPMVCRGLVSPNFEYTSFDNIFLAWLTMFVMASLSDWSSVMYGMWSGNPRIVVGIYCIALIITVSFVVLNFVCAIITASYAKARMAMKVVTTIVVQKEAQMSLPVFFFDRLVWWNFSPSLVRHLTYVPTATAKPTSNGVDAELEEEDSDTAEFSRRKPFFVHFRYQSLSNFLLLAVLVLHAINGTHMSQSYWDILRTVDVVYVVIFALEMVLSIVACGSIGKYFTNDWRKYEGLSFILAIFGVGMEIPLIPVRTLRWVRSVQTLGFVRRSNLLKATVRACRPSLVVTSFLLVCILVMSSVAVQIFSEDESGEHELEEYHTPPSALSSVLGTAAPTSTPMTRRANGTNVTNSTLSPNDTKNYNLSFVSPEPSTIPWADADPLNLSPNSAGHVENFNTVSLSISSIFKLVTADNWQELMYRGMKEQTWFLGLLFFIPASILFSYMLSSLFTAVVLDTFEPRKEIKLAWQKKEHDEEGRELEGTFAPDDDQKKPAGGSNGGAAGVPRRRRGPSEKRAFSISDNASNPGSLELGRTNSQAAMSPSLSRGGTGSDPAKATTVFADRVTRVEAKVKDMSLSLLGVENPFRLFMARLVVNKGDLTLTREEAEKTPRTHGHIFQWVIIFFVLLSCIFVAAAPPTEACSLRDLRSDGFKMANQAFDIIFVVVFTLEMLMKMVAHGIAFTGDDRPAWFGPTYFRDGWNILDFLLLVGMYIGFGYKEARAFRLFRVLRPLRVIGRVENMRLLAVGIANSLPNLFVIWVFSVYLLFIFAIVGVGMFAGKMQYCNAAVIGGIEVLKKADCVGVFLNERGILVPAAWLTYTSHFDHVPRAMSMLLEIASLSNWSRLMEQALNIVGPGQQPRLYASLQYSIFFFVFVITSAFFIVNIIVAVMLVSLDEQRGVLFLTKHQREWFTIRKEMVKLRPFPHPPPARFPKILRLVSAKQFDMAINVVIFLNIMTMASVHAHQTQGWTDMQYYANLAFLIVFVVEMVLKLLGLGKHYFYQGWNIYDGLITVISAIEFFVLLGQKSQGVAITSVGRAFRILRIFRSVRRVRNLRGLFHTLAHSLPAIFSLTAFLLILLFMYAVLGMVAFGNVKFQSAYNRDANFRSIDVAFLTLFRMGTLDGWNLLMNELQSYSGHYCSADQYGWWYYDSVTKADEPCGRLNDCSSSLAILFFFTFYTIGSFLFLNLVVAIMLDNFNYLATQTRVRIRIDHLDQFQDGWLRARRAIDLKHNYSDIIEPELLSRFIISLFNNENALVKNSKDQVDIHPVLTAASRMNYRKLVYELEAEAERQEIPLGRHCTFQNILLCCARMQMGKEALTLKQRHRREKFEEARSLYLVGDCILQSLRPVVVRARTRIQQRNETYALERQYSVRSLGEDLSFGRASPSFSTGNSGGQLADDGETHEMRRTNVICDLIGKRGGGGASTTVDQAQEFAASKGIGDGGGGDRRQESVRALDRKAREEEEKAKPRDAAMLSPGSASVLVPTVLTLPDDPNKRAQRASSREEEQPAGPAAKGPVSSASSSSADAQSLSSGRNSASTSPTPTPYGGQRRSLFVVEGEGEEEDEGAQHTGTRGTHQQRPGLYQQQEGEPLYDEVEVVLEESFEMLPLTPLTPEKGIVPGLPSGDRSAFVEEGSPLGMHQKQQQGTAVRKPQPYYAELHSVLEARAGGVASPPPLDTCSPVLVESVSIVDSSTGESSGKTPTTPTITTPNKSAGLKQVSFASERTARKSVFDPRVGTVAPQEESQLQLRRATTGKAAENGVVARPSGSYLATPGISNPTECEALLISLENEEGLLRTFVEESQQATWKRFARLQIQSEERYTRRSVITRRMKKMEVVARNSWVELEETIRQALVKSYHVEGWRIANSEAHLQAEAGKKKSAAQVPLMKEPSYPYPWGSEVDSVLSMSFDGGSPHPTPGNNAHPRPPPVSQQLSKPTPRRSSTGVTREEAVTLIMVDQAEEDDENVQQVIEISEFEPIAAPSALSPSVSQKRPPPTAQRLSEANDYGSASFVPRQNTASSEAFSNPIAQAFVGHPTASVAVSSTPGVPLLEGTSASVGRYNNTTQPHYNYFWDRDKREPIPSPPTATTVPNAAGTPSMLSSDRRAPTAAATHNPVRSLFADSPTAPAASSSSRPHGNHGTANVPFGGIPPHDAATPHHQQPLEEDLLDMCPQDRRCPQYNRCGGGHCYQYRHTCREGANCPLKESKSHCRFFSH